MMKLREWIDETKFDLFLLSLNNTNPYIFKLLEKNLNIIDWYNLNRSVLFEEKLEFIKKYNYNSIE